MKRGITHIIQQDQHLQNLRKIIKRDYFTNTSKQQHQNIDQKTPKMGLDSYLSSHTSKQNKLFAQLVYNDKQQWKEKHWWVHKQDKIKMITSQQDINNNNNSKTHQYRNMIEGDKQRNGINTNIIQQQAKNALFFKQDSGYSSYLEEQYRNAKKILHNNCRLGQSTEQLVKRHQNLNQNQNNSENNKNPAAMMTWGQIQNTPLRLSGPQYKIQDTPIRQQVLYKLNQKINKQKIQKNKKKSQIVHKLLGSITPSLKKSSYRIVPSSSMRRVQNSQKRIQKDKNNDDQIMSGLLELGSKKN